MPLDELFDCLGCLGCLGFRFAHARTTRRKHRVSGARSGIPREIPSRSEAKATRKCAVQEVCRVVCSGVNLYCISLFLTTLRVVATGDSTTRCRIARGRAHHNTHSLSVGCRV